MSATTSSTGTRRTAAGTLTAALCLLHALVLTGLAAYYLVELTAGAGSDRARVLTSAVLILVFAVLLAVLARLWWTGSRWATTPTIVWNIVLVPVAVTLLQAGQVVLGAALAVVAVLGVVAAAAGRSA